MDIDQFEALLLQPLREDSIAAIQNFQEDSSNIEKCQKRLETPGCPQNLQIFLSSTILKLVKKYVNVSDNDFSYSLLTWCQNLYLQNYSSLHRSVTKTLSEIFGHIVYELWDNNMETKFNLMLTNLNDLPVHIACKLDFMTATICAFSSKTENNSNTAKSRLLLVFANKLEVFYNISRNYLNNFYSTNSELVDLCLLLINSVFEYGGEKRIPLRNDLMTSCDEIEFLFFIFNKTKNVQSLINLCLVLKLDNSSFGCCLSDVVSCFVECLNDTFSQNENGSLESSHLFYISVLLCSLAKKIDTRLLTHCSEIIINLYNNVYALTFSLLDQVNAYSNENNQVYVNLLDFWASISNTSINLGNNPLNIFTKEKVAEIATRHVMFVLNLLSTNCSEIIEYIMTNDELLNPICSFISLNPVDTIPSIFEIFSKTNDQISLALFLRISRVSLKVSQKMDCLDDVRNFKRQIFDRSLEIIILSQEFTENGTESLILEHAVLHFIDKLHFDTSAKENDILLKRIYISLKIFFENFLIVEICLNALKWLTTSSKELSYSSIHELFLNNYSEFNFLKRPDNIKNRSCFFAIIFSLAFKYGELKYFFSKYEYVFIEGNALLICADLIGILKSDEKISPKITSVIIEWILSSNHIDFFNDHIQNPPEMLQILKLWQNLLCNNIHFTNHSANGIVLFHAFSNSFAKVFEFWMANTAEEVRFSLLKRMIPCLTSILNNKYILFDAFRIYNDQSLPNLLGCICPLIDAVGFDAILQYTKIYNLFILLFNAVNEIHLPICSSQYFIQVANFYLASFQKIEFHVLYKSEIDIGFQRLLSFCNQKVFAGTDDDIKSTLLQPLSMINLIIWEITMNNQNVTKCYKLLKLLSLFDIRFLYEFQERFAKNLPNPEKCLETFAAMEAHVKSMASERDNDFAILIEDCFNLAKEVPNSIRIVTPLDQ